MIRKFAKLIPEDLLQKSGSVFYSGIKAWRSPAPLYVLGVNPGGQIQPQSLGSRAKKRNLSTFDYRGLLHG